MTDTGNYIYFTYLFASSHCCTVKPGLELYRLHIFPIVPIADCSDCSNSRLWSRYRCLQNQRKYLKIFINGFVTFVNLKLFLYNRKRKSDINQILWYKLVKSHKNIKIKIGKFTDTVFKCFAFVKKR